MVKKANTMHSMDKKMHHPVTELEQPNGQTHEKAGHQRKRAGSNNNVEVCCRNKGSNANEPSYAQAEPYKCSGEQSQ